MFLINENKRDLKVACVVFCAVSRPDHCVYTYICSPTAFQSCYAGGACGAILLRWRAVQRFHPEKNQVTERRKDQKWRRRIQVAIKEDNIIINYYRGFKKLFHMPLDKVDPS